MQSWLPTLAALAAQRVCSRLHEVRRHPHTWRRLQLPAGVPLFEALHHLHRAGGSTRRFAAPDGGKRRVDDLEEMVDLEELEIEARLQRGGGRDRELSLPALRRLRLVRMPTEAEAGAIALRLASGAPQLRELALSGCAMSVAEAERLCAGLPSAAPQLRSLHIGWQVRATYHCPLSHNRKALSRR